MTKQLSDLIYTTSKIKTKLKRPIFKSLLRFFIFSNHLGKGRMFILSNQQDM